MAAGQSRRFGETCKLSARVDSGCSLLEQTVKTIQQVSSRICIVASASNEGVAVIGHRLGVELALYPNQSPGLGDSITYGVKATSGWGGWIICLADMPRINSGIYQQVLALSAGYPLVSPQFDGRRGHPVYFSSRYYKQLIQLKGDRGAGSILKQNGADLKLFDCGCPGVLQDVDTPQQLAELPPG